MLHDCCSGHFVTVPAWHQNLVRRQKFGGDDCHCDHAIGAGLPICCIGMLRCHKKLQLRQGNVVILTMSSLQSCFSGMFSNIEVTTFRLDGHCCTNVVILVCKSNVVRESEGAGTKMGDSGHHIAKSRQGDVMLWEGEIFPTLFCFFSFS